MEVTQTLSEGLKREFKVVMPLQELQSRLDGQIAEMKDKVRINGFRPGKVPIAHLKRLYGRSIMADIVQKAIGEAETKIIGDNSLRFALQPKFDIPTEKDAVESVLDAKSDFAFTVSGEVLPTVEIGSLDDLTLERPVAAVPEEDVEAALHRLVTQHRTYTPATEEGAAARDDDRITLDFTGRIDGEVFEGGNGSDVPLVLGSRSFLPGFEEQLIGVKVGESRTLNVTFPTDYPAANLAGKDAVFEVTAKEVATPDTIEVNDEFAKGYGSDSLEELKTAIRSNFEADLARASRMKLKRQLLDALDKRYEFGLPQSLVDQEFENIWRQVETEQKNENRTFADEGTTEEAARADYRRIAERRVRLGLVMAAIGEASGVTVSQEEMRQGLVEHVRRFTGREKEVWDLYQKNPELMQHVRAPIYEDKVVDIIVERANVSDRTVSREELFKPDDEELPRRGVAAEASPAAEQHARDTDDPAPAAEHQEPEAAPSDAASAAAAEYQEPEAGSNDAAPAAEHQEPEAGSNDAAPAAAAEAEAETKHPPAG